MKKPSFLAIICVLMLLSVSQSASAQAKKPYKEGPVWLVSYVRTKDGMKELYLKDLSTHWVKLMHAAKTEGYIVDYKVLDAPPANPRDWDLMLMVEVKNFGSVDILEKQLDPLAASMLGQDSIQHKTSISRNDLRVQWGQRLLQELDFK